MLSWQIVRRDEARRRVPSSVDQVVMPDLMQDSSILTHKHISEVSSSGTFMLIRVHSLRPVFFLFRH